MNKTLIGYRLKPLYKEDMTGMQTSTSMVCGVSNMPIHGCGGGGRYISAKAWDEIRGNSDLRCLIRDEIIKNER